MTDGGNESTPGAPGVIGVKVEEHLIVAAKGQRIEEAPQQRGRRLVFEPKRPEPVALVGHHKVASGVKG